MGGCPSRVTSDVVQGGRVRVQETEKEGKLSTQAEGGLPPPPREGKHVMFGAAARLGQQLPRRQIFLPPCYCSER